MVLDPKLREHLAHWGINLMTMTKTEKTMAELQVDLNVRFEFDAITEAGAALAPLPLSPLPGRHPLGIHAPLP